MGILGRTLSLFFALVVFGVASVRVLAADDAVLTIINHGAGGVVEKTEFTLHDISALNQKTIVTTTPWTDGAQEFVGVACNGVLENIRRDVGEYVAKALNDYSVTIPAPALNDDACLIAVKRNGELMSVREKGPLWIVFPYDEDEKFESSAYQSYSIWSLSSIEAR